MWPSWIWRMKLLEPFKELIGLAISCNAIIKNMCFWFPIAWSHERSYNCFSKLTKYDRNVRNGFELKYTSFDREGYVLIVIISFFKALLSFRSTQNCHWNIPKKKLENEIPKCMIWRYSDFSQGDDIEVHICRNKSLMQEKAALICDHVFTCCNVFSILKNLSSERYFVLHLSPE